MVNAVSMEWARHWRAFSLMGMNLVNSAWKWKLLFFVTVCEQREQRHMQTGSDPFVSPTENH